MDSKPISDAVAFARALPAGMPVEVDLCDDEMVTFGVRGADREALIVFMGDGEASYSVRVPGGFYGPNITEFELENGVPGPLAALIASAPSRPA